MMIGDSGLANAWDGQSTNCTKLNRRRPSPRSSSIVGPLRRTGTASASHTTPSQRAWRCLFRIPTRPLRIFRVRFRRAARRTEFGMVAVTTGFDRTAEYQSAASPAREPQITPLRAWIPTVSPPVRG